MKRVRCIRNWYDCNITEGNIYDVIDEDDNRYKTKDDNNCDDWIPKLSFELIDNNIKKEAYKLPNIIIMNGKKYERAKLSLTYIKLGNEKVFNIDIIRNILLRLINEGKYILVKSEYQRINEIDLGNMSASVEAKIITITEDIKKIIFKDLFHTVQPEYSIDGIRYRPIKHNIEIGNQYIIVKKDE